MNHAAIFYNIRQHLPPQASSRLRHMNTFRFHSVALACFIAAIALLVIALLVSTAPTAMHAQDSLSFQARLADAMIQDEASRNAMLTGSPPGSPHRLGAGLSVVMSDIGNARAMPMVSTFYAFRFSERWLLAAAAHFMHYSETSEDGSLDYARNSAGTVVRYSSQFNVVYRTGHATILDCMPVLTLLGNDRQGLSIGAGVALRFGGILEDGKSTGLSVTTTTNPATPSVAPMVKIDTLNTTGVLSGQRDPNSPTGFRLIKVGRFGLQTALGLTGMIEYRFPIGEHSSLAIQARTSYFLPPVYVLEDGRSLGAFVIQPIRSAQPSSLLAIYPNNGGTISLGAVLRIGW
jgi:hypothetical protein